MNAESPILRPVAGYAIPFTLLVALRIFFQGHDEPGGGFIAGVLVASAGAIHLLSYGVERAARIRWWRVAVIGLLVSVCNGIWPMLLGHPYMDNEILHWPVHLPTATFFDLGVMLIVVGTLMTIFVELSLERR